MFYIFHSVSALCDIKEGWLPCEIIILKEEQAKKKKKGSEGWISQWKVH